MTEYWKASPNYWCKHCSTYVRDTKLERQNHEATARHQGNIKRSLRDLHRNHEREEREKERARREISRLNDVVSSTPSGPSSSWQGANPSSQTGSSSSESQLKKQREQLAEMGVAMPSDIRPEMAMPGEWTVTSTKVIDEKDRFKKPESLATGVRKREVTENEKDEEDAVQKLFKKPKRWGRDSKNILAGDDAELDALLSGTAIPLKNDGAVKPEQSVENHADESGVKEEIKEEDGVKDEPDTAAGGLSDAAVKTEVPDAPVKQEGEGEGGDGADQAGPAPVMFKKRKPKGLRAK